MKDIPIEWIIKYPVLQCPGRLFGVDADHPEWIEWKRQRDLYLIDIEQIEAAAAAAAVANRDDPESQGHIFAQGGTSSSNNNNVSGGATGPGPTSFQRIHPLGSSFSMAHQLAFEPWAVGAPLIPTSTQGSPKVVLNSLYGKEYDGTPITTASFFSWETPQEASQERRGYTSVFVCPVTYEIFPSGRYDSMALTKAGKGIQMWKEEEDDDDDVDEDGFNGIVPLVWYSRKMEAEQGAAAFRYDCWYYRKWLENNPLAPKYTLIGMEKPYAKNKDHQQRLMERIPVEVIQGIERQIQVWKDKAAVRALELEANIMEAEQDTNIEAEEVAYREAYFEIRGDLRHPWEAEPMIQSDDEEESMTRSTTDQG